MKNRQNNILTLATKPERKNKKADVKFVKKNARNLPPSARTSLGQMVDSLKKVSRREIKKVVALSVELMKEMGKYDEKKEERREEVAKKVWEKRVAWKEFFLDGDLFAFADLDFFLGRDEDFEDVVR